VRCSLTSSRAVQDNTALHPSMTGCLFTLTSYPDTVNTINTFNLIKLITTKRNLHLCETYVLYYYVYVVNISKFLKSQFIKKQSRKKTI